MFTETFYELSSGLADIFYADCFIRNFVFQFVIVKVLFSHLLLGPAAKHVTRLAHGPTMLV